MSFGNTRNAFSCFQFFSNSNRRNKATTKNRDYQVLEPRQMLAAGITFDAGTVFIEGSNDNDSVQVNLNGDWVIVTMTGGFEESYDLSTVDLIRFRGLDGDDRFTNNTNINATAFGHDGNDRFVGGGGHNRFQGGKGDDVLIGGGRNDSLRGRGGDDIILGGRRHDRLFGGDGNDEIRGEHGRDRINGDAGEDQLIGGDHDDRINGGVGNDNINGNDGNDRLFGGDDDDTINGGDGLDRIFGEDGDDSIRGFEGDDLLRGGAGSDELLGGIGNDSLFGGTGDSDSLDGQEGSDRLLLMRNDKPQNVEDTDAQIQFADQGNLLQGGLWINEQVELVDEAFGRIVSKSGGQTTLLKDSLSDNIVEVRKLDSAAPANEIVDGVRTITLANWDSTDDAANDAATLSTINLVARSWDSFAEISASSLGQDSESQLSAFRAISSWGQGEQTPSGFVDSGDGEWYYQAGTEFVDERGNINPFEDWASAWEISLSSFVSDSELTRLADKLAGIDAFFETIG
ncbi:MAG: calcium-binding protein [Planctomycetota bacterium]